MKIRDRVLNAKDIRSEKVIVADWDNVEIEVRGLGLGARNRLLKQSKDEDGNQDPDKLYPAILIACCFDPETGEPVFTDADRDALNEKATGPVEKVAQVALRVLGISGDEVGNG